MADRSICVAALEGDFARLSAGVFPLPLNSQMLWWFLWQFFFWPCIKIEPASNNNNNNNNNNKEQKKEKKKERQGPRTLILKHDSSNTEVDVPGEVAYPPSNAHHSVGPDYAVPARSQATTPTDVALQFQQGTALRHQLLRMFNMM